MDVFYLTLTKTDKRERWNMSKKLVKREPTQKKSHIIAASPNQKHTDYYHGYNNKYWWIKGTGINAEFRML